MQKNSRNIKIDVTLCLGIAIFVVIFDQITKLAVVSTMELGQSIDVIKGIFRFTYITNEGSAFGMFADSRWVFMVFSTLGIGAMLAYAIGFAKDNSRLTMISFGMVIGGGIGNMIDRLFNGKSFGSGVVIDFLDFCAFPELWKWIFNVADSFVCVGIAMLFISFVLDELSRRKNAKSAETANAGADVSAEIDTDNEESNKE